MQLSDEVAEEVMREAARAKLERCLATALQNVKTRTKKSDYTPAVQVLHLCCPCCSRAGLASSTASGMWGQSAG